MESNEIEMTGLDGANPLAFLGALGVLRSSHAMFSDDANPLMSWKLLNGVWNPIIILSTPVTHDGFVQALNTYLSKMAGHPALTFSKNLQIPQMRFRQLCENAVQTWCDKTDTVASEFFSAFGCDGIVDDKNDVNDTALRTMSGGGHQDFVKFMSELAKITTSENIAEAVFGPWRYDDPRPSLRFDPSDDRRYALRWRNPSQDKIRTVRGANRLAVEGIPLLSVAPVGRKLETTGFSGHRRNNTYWTWPIWSAPVSLDTCRSLLSMKALQGQQSNESLFDLKARGIKAVFRTQRITVGKYRNFTPATQIA
jgi:hypothetical protein